MSIHLRLVGKMNDDARTTGMGLWTDANQMLRAAKHLMTAKEFELSSPLYFLLGHSLELSFKAYLRAQGVSLDALKDFGHNLESAKSSAAKSGIEAIVQLTGEEAAAIALLNEYYVRKQFEYRVTGSKVYPPAPLLVGIIERVLGATRNICAASI